MQWLWRGLLAAAALMAEPAAAQGGSLPKGPSDTDEPPAKSGPSPKGAKGADGAAKPRSCFSSLAAPPGGNGAFSPDGKWLYLLVQNAEPKGKKAVKPDAKVRHTLLKIDLRSRENEAVLALDLSPNASLMTFGDPIATIGAVAFTGRTSGCYEGAATVLTIPLGHTDESPVHVAGEFQLVETPGGRRLVDLKKGAIPELDPGSFQQKHGRKVRAGERPLYFDPVKRLLTCWRGGTAQASLVAYEGDGAGAKTKSLALQPGERVLQSGGRFGVLHVDQAKNALEIQELDDWTDVSRPGRFKLTVPPIYSVASAGVELNFDKRLALVYAANFLAKQRWQRVFVYNYGTSELLGTVQVTGTQYLNFAGIDPMGTYAVLEVRDMDTRQTVGVKLYTFAKKTVDDLNLVIPKS